MNNTNDIFLIYPVMDNNSNTVRTYSGFSLSLSKEEFGCFKNLSRNQFEKMFPPPKTCLQLKNHNLFLITNSHNSVREVFDNYAYIGIGQPSKPIDSCKSFKEAVNSFLDWDLPQIVDSAPSFRLKAPIVYYKNPEDKINFDLLTQIGGFYQSSGILQNSTNLDGIIIITPHLEVNFASLPVFKINLYLARKFLSGFLNHKKARSQPPSELTFNTSCYVEEELDLNVKLEPVKDEPQQQPYSLFQSGFYVNLDNPALIPPERKRVQVKTEYPNMISQARLSEISTKTIINRESLICWIKFFSDKNTYSWIDNNNISLEFDYFCLIDDKIYGKKKGDFIWYKTATEKSYDPNRIVELMKSIHLP